MMPFAEEVDLARLDGETRDYLLQTSKNPEKIIRAFRLPLLAKVDFPETSPEEIAAIVKRLFDELSTFNIKVPVEFAIGHDREKADIASLYVITDKIHPAVIEKEFVAQKFDALYVSLVRYFGAKYVSGEYFLADIADDAQYIFGTRTADTVPDLYLVDTDVNVQKGRQIVLAQLLSLERLIRQREAASGMILPKSRGAFTTLLTTLDPDDRNRIERYKFENGLSAANAS